MICKFKRKAIAFMMMLAMTASLVFVFGPATVNAADGTYRMPSRLKTYAYENGKWKKTNDRTFKYDSKGNLKNWDGSVLKLTYNGNKLKKVTVATRKNTPDECNTTKTYNSKGNIRKIVYYYPEIGETTVTFKYNAKGYIKSWTYRGMDFKTVYKYAITGYYANGMPKQITSTNNYDDEKIIENFDKNGFCTSSKTYEGKKLMQSYTVSFKMSGNMIRYCVENYKIKDGKKTNYKWKYVYSYSGNAKVKDGKQYAAFISMTHDTFLFRTVGNNSAVGWCR